MKKGDEVYVSALWVVFDKYWWFLYCSIGTINIEIYKAYITALWKDSEGEWQQK